MSNVQCLPYLLSFILVYRYRDAFLDVLTITIIDHHIKSEVCQIYVSFGCILLSLVFLICYLSFILFFGSVWLYFFLINILGIQDSGRNGLELLVQSN